jgi:hypothetical protein
MPWMPPGNTGYFLLIHQIARRFYEALTAARPVYDTCPMAASSAFAVCATRS